MIKCDSGRLASHPVASAVAVSPARRKGRHLVVIPVPCMQRMMDSGV